MKLTTPLASLVLLLACAAPGAASAAPWSAPADIGAPAPAVLAPGLAFAHTGFGLLTWQIDAQPTFSTATLQLRNDGVSSAALALGPPAATLQRTPDSIVAGPVFEDRGRGLVLRTLAVAAGPDGTRRTRLSWSAVDGAGRLGGLHTITTATLGATPSLAEDHLGNAIAAWSELLPVAPHADVGRYRIRAAWRPAGRAFGAPVTLGTADAPGYARNGAVAATIGRAGRAVVAFADLRVNGGRDRKRVLVWSRTPRRGFGAAQAVGAHSDAADFALAVSDRGRIFVAWGTQDGGEEANTPWILRVATQAPRATRFGAARVIDTGASSRLRPPGAIQLALDPEGRAILAWSAVRAGPAFPVLAATSDTAGHFATPQQVAPSGALGGLAVRQDGAAILAYANIAAASPFGADATDQAFAAVRSSAGQPFGAPEAIAAPDHALAPVVAFDPVSGRPTAAWAARPSTTATTAVLRVATRDAP